jgi:hypothetical protein
VTGFGSPHTELEGQAIAFERALIRQRLAIARQGDPIRPPGRKWSPYFFLVLKSLTLFQIFRMALDGGVQS